MDASLPATLRRAVQTLLVLALAAPVAFTTTDASAQPRRGAAAKVDLVTRGKQLFDDQQYEESIQALSGALVRPSTTRDERIEVLRLLSLNYITLGRKEEAEGAVRALFVIDPKYTLAATESPRFRDFYQSVRDRWEKEGRPGFASEAAKSNLTMTHVSPAQAEANSNIEITAKVSDPSKVARVRLFVREAGNGKFVAQGMKLTGDTARTTISGPRVKPPLLEYYIEGQDSGGIAIVGKGDIDVPLRIAIPESRSGWVLPVAIGAGVLGAAAIVGGLALGGVFDKSQPTRFTTVSINVP